MLLDVQTPRTGHPTFWNGVMLFERGKLKSATGLVAARLAKQPPRPIAA
jgi:hypothetical protein